MVRASTTSAKMQDGRTLRRYRGNTVEPACPDGSAQTHPAAFRQPCFEPRFFLACMPQQICPSTSIWIWPLKLLLRYALLVIKYWPPMRPRRWWEHGLKASLARAKMQVIIAMARSWGNALWPADPGGFAQAHLPAFWPLVVRPCFKQALLYRQKLAPHEAREIDTKLFQQAMFRACPV